MSPPPEPLRISFEAGTLLIEGLPETDSRGLPGLRRDPRSSAFRAEAIFYRLIIEDLRKKAIPYVDSARAYQPVRWEIAIDKPAFPHQTEGLAAWEAGGKLGVVVLPTGTGKTHLANLCIHAAGRPSLIVTPTIDLMNQWFDELSVTFAADVGLLGGGYYEIKPLTVTTYDSAYMNMDRIGNKFGLIIFDECHHLPGPTYGLAATCSIAPFRLGLTATPERADMAHVQTDRLIGPIVYRREITQLRGQYLADYRTEMLYVNLSESERLRYESCRETYRQFLSDHGIDLRRPAPGASSSRPRFALPRGSAPIRRTGSRKTSRWPPRRRSACCRDCSTATTAIAS